MERRARGSPARLLPSVIFSAKRYRPSDPWFHEPARCPRRGAPTRFNVKRSTLEFNFTARRVRAGSRGEYTYFIGERMHDAERQFIAFYRVALLLSHEPVEASPRFAG